MYRLRKAPKRDLYWVVGEDGKKHSLEPISKEMAEKQMIALNIAHARKLGHKIPPPAVKIPVKEFKKEHKRLTKLLSKVKGELATQLKEL